MKDEKTSKRVATIASKYLRMTFHDFHLHVLHVRKSELRKTFREIVAMAGSCANQTADKNIVEEIKRARRAGATNVSITDELIKALGGSPRDGGTPIHSSEAITVRQGRKVIFSGTAKELRALRKKKS